MPPLLPAELILRIILFSVLPSSLSPSFDTLRSRYSLLRSYSLSSRSLTRWAQLEMYRLVLLRGRNVASFQRSSLAAAKGGVLKKVESVRVLELGAYASRESLGPILRRCEGLRDLRMMRAGVSVVTLGLAPSEHALCYL